MSRLSEDFYEVNQELLQKIEEEFVFLENKNWRQLYQNKKTKEYWILDEPEKYRRRCFFKLNSKKNWSSFNDEPIRMKFLKTKIGLSKSKCLWKGCNEFSLKEFAFCVLHAYKEMGMR